MEHKKISLEYINHRDLLHQVAEDIIETCNKIYLGIDRNPHNIDTDVKPLIRVFNKLVQENQIILQHLYPKRPNVLVTHLALKNKQVTRGQDTNEVVEETEMLDER